MSMDLVKKLTVSVSPRILKDESDNALEKDQALCRFYPFLLSILRIRPSLITDFSQQLHPHISALFYGDASLQHQFLHKFQQQLNNPIPEAEFKHILNRAIVPTLGFLEHEAGTTHPEAIVHLLDLHAQEIRQALPLWTHPLLASFDIRPLAHSGAVKAMHARKIHQQDKKLSSWLPFLILLMLGSMMLFFYRVYVDYEELNEKITTYQQSEKM